MLPLTRLEERAVAERKKKNLVIVESPAKARTINKYLGPEFEVAASKGHVRDLPDRKFGIDIDKGWRPTYQTLADRKELIASLKKQAAKAEKAAAQGRIEYQKKLEQSKAQEKHDQARQKLNEVKAAGEERWEALKSGLEGAWKELKKTVESTKME